jgi:hypothetical protein
MCDRRRCDESHLEPLTSARFFAALLQPLLALLLLAGAPAAERVPGGHSAFVRVLEGSINALALLPDRTESHENLGQGELDQPDGDDGPDHLVLTTEASHQVLDRARIIRIGRASYPTAPPSHRACAAPPTGPPFA